MWRNPSRCRQAWVHRVRATGGHGTRDHIFASSPLSYVTVAPWTLKRFHALATTMIFPSPCRAPSGLATIPPPPSRYTYCIYRPWSFEGTLRGISGCFVSTKPGEDQDDHRGLVFEEGVESARYRLDLAFGTAKIMRPVGRLISLVTSTSTLRSMNFCPDSTTTIVPSSR